MKVSINWIKDFVNLDGIDIEKLLSKFTMSVAEIEGIEYKGKNVEGVVSAKVLEVEEVLNSKKLHLLKVDDGKNVLQIVCGAPNVRVGMITALAQIGAKLNDIRIEKAKLAGVESFGMCCSGDELGISDDHFGIIELDKNTPVGKNIKEILNLEDIVFEIDNKSLTNRPDLWGHYGIAREIAALTGRKLKNILLQDLDDFKNLPTKTVQIKSKNCFRYTTACMENITKAKADLNMQIRLFYCGMRGINLLADVTNYVMLELGQPMHAFDNQIVDNIQVFDLEKDFDFKTLDGNKRLLQKGNMVIATNGFPVALAGIMGGENSEITDKTNSVLIESANFDSFTVRKTATSLGMRTESSSRYEKSLDPELTMTALLRYIYLIKQQDKAAKISSGITDVYTKKFKKIEIVLDKKFVDSFIGIEISEEKLLSILNSLEFSLIEKNKNVYKFSVPSFRATKDINGKADLIEEITRIFGYDNIIPKTLTQQIKPAILSNEIKNEYETKLCLAQRFDLNEVHTYIWYDFATNLLLGIEPPSVLRCVNSINKDNDKIRATIIPSLLKVVLDNKNLNDFGVFEIGRVVKNLKDNLANETKSLGIVLYGKNSKIEEKLLKLKEILNYIFDYILKIKLDFSISSPSQKYYHPKNFYVIKSQGIELGEVFSLHPLCQNNIENGCSVVGCEINFSKVCQSPTLKTKFLKLSKFPTTKLDFNFLIPHEMLYKDIIEYANSIKTNLNFTVSLLDIYEDLKNKTKSYTLHYELNSFDKTLTTEDIDMFHKAVIQKFKQNKIELKL